MTRRGFWLAVGAAGGIAGYRRAVAVGRSLSGRLEGTALDTARKSAQARKARRGLVRGTIRFSRDARSFTREARSFTRDVREGMDLYMARHPGREAPTLGASERTNVKDDR